MLWLLLVPAYFLGTFPSAVWIALTKDTYGIHGSPEPKLIGKTASHGCVRLTNWDARELAGAVKPGTTVTFVGDEPPRPTA